MSIKTALIEKDGIYFITFTCQSWLPLFALTNGYDTVYNWFDYLKSNGHFILAYVIMPNHVHALIGFKASAKNINTIVSNGKRFIAYEIITRLKNSNQHEVLRKLAAQVSASDKKRGKQHQVFEPSFDSKECVTDAFINQKLAYIHANPCNGKWNLSNSPEAYMHGSAAFYIAGTQGIYTITNFKELDDVDLAS